MPALLSCPPDLFHTLDIHERSPHKNILIASPNSITIHEADLNLNNKSIYSDYCCQAPENSIPLLNRSRISACTYGAVKLIKRPELPPLFFDFICSINGVFRSIVLYELFTTVTGACGMARATFRIWWLPRNEEKSKVKQPALIENSFLRATRGWILVSNIRICAKWINRTFN